MVRTLAGAAARLHLSTRWARLAVLGMLPRRGTGAEIGVHLGDYAARILQVARPQRLYLIDPWLYFGDDTYRSSLYGGSDCSPAEMERRFQSVRRRFSSRTATGQVNIIRKTSAQAMEAIGDSSLDFVYIDGNHQYEFVKDDLAQSVRTVRPGGIVAGDDYTSGGWWAGGVKRAVDELSASKDVDLLWISGRQYVFRRK